ncbi:MAG TPA: DUF4293 domain-containing protein [Balneolaceae bacterium]|nr:DUF4293 domain-containing protein [Balneolaceae bacterium]
MIQRIQSVYLLLAAILNVAIFFNSLYGQAQADPALWVGLGFTIALILAAVTSIISIFLYQNRDMQIKLTSVSAIFQVISLGWGVGIFISLGGFGTFLWDEGLGVLFLLIAVIAVFMARKKIRDDRELVKSMDRIR